VDWAASAVYFAHFTVTDVGANRFYSDERWSRGALGLAGARPARGHGGAAFDAWVESWSARWEGDGPHLVARSGDVAIDLRLVPERAATLQGDRGLSHKSVDPGNASYYYSITRLETMGTVRVGARAARVVGLSWLDREWSTSALSRQEVGWDWFSLQLSDGRDVMLYRMRRLDGTVDPQSSGSVTRPGSSRGLALSDFGVESLGRWRSPRSQAAYPSGWRIRIPSEHLDLVVEPWIADQELGTSFVYWEGAVKVRSSTGALTGNGYVELTGYAR
jgi:predicted secreted hydrolase